MKTTPPGRILLAALALAAVPLADGAAADRACNVTTSLASGITDPVAGDDTFFKVTSPGANVMLLLDTSGSMGNLVHCRDAGWGQADCISPVIANPAAPAANKTGAVAIAGTCAPASLAAAYTTGTVPAVADLSWMEAVTPQRAYADPGNGGNQASDDMFDCPPWGAGPGCTTRCSGDGCLYDPDAYYDGALEATLTNNDAIRRPQGAPVVASDTTSPPLFTAANGVATVPNSATTLTLGAVAMKCMAERGFFIYNATYPTTGCTAFTNCGGYVSTGVKVLMRGTFLNGSPPKVLTARKVVKDILWMTQDASTGPYDTVRFGLTWFGHDNPGIVSPLVPSSLAVLNATYSKATFRAARQPIIAFINNPANDFAVGGTPIGKTLLDVGQYFSQQASTGYSSYFAYTATGKSNWTSGFTNCGGNCSAAGFVPSTSGDSCAVCYPTCQQNSVIMITDGAPNETQNNTAFPNDILTNASLQTDFARWCPSTCNADGVVGAGTQVCCPQLNSTNTGATVVKVAGWLNKYNLWPTKSPSRAVNVTTYAIGFGLQGLASNTLSAIGHMGGGDSVNASNASALNTALRSFTSKANQQETSFSAPAVDTLQTTQSTTSDVFLTRFIPNNSSTWEGHVFQAALFDELGNGCDPTKAPADQTLVPCLNSLTQVNPDLDQAVDGAGHAICNKVFVVDRNCKPIGENTSKGGFYLLDSNGAITNDAASLPWDAGEVLSNTSNRGNGYRSACDGSSGAPCNGTDTPRNILTWLPDTGAQVAFTLANLATLKPYLNIEPTWCTQLLTQIGFSTLPADQLTECARQVVLFVRGYDVFGKSSTGCRAPGNPSNALACGASGTDFGTERDRNVDQRTKKLAYKLGDIYHSTPVAVRLPASEKACDLAYDGQCVATIHSPQQLPNPTPNPVVAGKDGYDTWRSNLVAAGRKRVVLAGSNDGMLHAFDAGAPTGATDRLGTYQYTDGNGEELWAFIPGDLLPKLWRLVKDGALEDHQAMVDGPTMVRDVWVDGTSQGSNAVGVKNGSKEAGEFHTVAILSERAGGQHFTGLDVTDPTAPRVLWTFPRPLSPEAKYMGLSWTDFSGRPPPIGPVRLQAANARGFEERWVAMLNGGYDPTLVRGRAVFMVDVWTGATIWRVTDDDLKTGGMNSLGFGTGTSLFPVAAAVALMDIGDPTKNSSDVDGFFDTATWGDLGGNLWVARFGAPGVIGASGRVENWFASRTFEQGRVTGNTQSAWNRQPFFTMTANVFEGTSRTLRSYLGSGNRERLAAAGPTCGQDNLIGCCQSGCTVSATVADNFAGACGWTSTFACDASGNMTHAAVTDSPASCNGLTSCATASSPFTASASVAITACPAATAGLGTTTGSVSCDGNGTCSSSASTPAMRQLGNGTVTFTGNAPPPTRFFGIWSYGRDARKMFSSLAEAATFDANRFTDNSSYAGTCTTANSTCRLVDTTASTVSYDPSNPTAFTVAGASATLADPGWTYRYQGTNEKTGAGGAALVFGCAAWSGMIATTAPSGNSCESGAIQVTSRSYLSSYVSGVPTPTCGFPDQVGAVTRYAEQQTAAPPSGSAVRVVVDPSGKVSYSALQLNAGSSPTSQVVGTSTSQADTIYWLEVPRDLHACRHDPATSSSTCK